jgi:hypothetical protein
MLVACPTLIGLGWQASRIHYPVLFPLDVAEAPLDLLPGIELDDLGEDPQPFCAGGVLAPRGALAAYIVAELSVGVLTAIAANVARDLKLMQTGLPIITATPGPVGEATWGAEASAEDSTTPAQIRFKAVTIDITYGFTA